MSSAARIAATAGSPTTPAATAIARSARARRRRIGSPRARPICCRSTYFHVVFTLPAEIAAIAYQNKAVVYDLLFRAAAETLLTIAADPKHLGARIGVTAVLHSWGSAMTHHPHRPHDRAGRRHIARRTRAGCPADPASSCRCGCSPACSGGSSWRGSPTPTRRAGWRSSARLEGLRRRAGLRRASRAAQRKKWFVYAKPPFAGPEAVLAYLARYTHRVAISNSRLVGLDERGVTFRYKDYRRNGRARFRTMTLAPDEFIRRFLLHVLPKGFHRIRHYGLLASATCKTNIARARELIAARAGDRSAGRARRGGPSRRRRDRPSPAMPLLRWPHDYRRDLRARRAPRAPPSPDAGVRTATP